MDEEIKFERLKRFTRKHQVAITNAAVLAGSAVFVFALVKIAKKNQAKTAAMLASALERGDTVIPDGFGGFYFISQAVGE